MTSSRQGAGAEKGTQSLREPERLQREPLLHSSEVNLPNSGQTETNSPKEEEEDPGVGPGFKSQSKLGECC